METVRVVMGTLSVILFIFELGLLLKRTNFKFTFIHHNALYFGSMYISLALALIGLLLGRNLYGKWDIMLLMIIAWNGFFTVLKIIMKIFGKKQPQYEIIEVNKEDYEIFSEFSNFILQQANSYMKIKRNNKEELVIFTTEPPKVNENIMMQVVRCEEKGMEYYLCNNFMYKRNNHKQWIDFLLSLYAVMVFTYGYIVASYSWLTTAGYLDEKYSKLLCIPIAYALFSSCFNATREGKDSFTKFIHYVFLPFYVLTIIMLVLFWII